MLRWLIQRDVIVIAKLVKKERMKQNIEVFDFALTDEDMKKIATLDTAKSTIHGSPKKVRNCKMDCDIQDGRKINMNS